MIATWYVQAGKYDVLPIQSSAPQPVLSAGLLGDQILAVI